MTLKNALKDKVVLITGAASGIGAATAREAASMGATVVLADVNDEAGKAVADEIGTPSSYVHLDVTSMQEWQDVVGKVVAEHGGIDIVHLNAGVLTRPASVPIFDDPVPWLTEEGWRKVGGVNTDGVIFGTIATIPHLEARGGGKIFIGMSGAGYGGWAVDPYYSASKAAVLSWHQAMSEVLQAKNITVNTVDPGRPTDGGMPSKDYREMGLPLQDPTVVGQGIARHCYTSDETGQRWVKDDEGDAMITQDEYSAKALAAMADANTEILRGKATT